MEQIVKYATEPEVDDFLKGIENHPDVERLVKHYNRPVQDVVKALHCRVIINRRSSGKIVRLNFTDTDSGIKIKTRKRYVSNSGS